MTVTRGTRLALAVAAATMLPAAQSVAQEGVTFNGEVELSGRYYPQAGFLPGQTSQGLAPIVGGSLGARKRFDSGSAVFEFSGLYNAETGEGYADIPRGYYQYFGDGYDFLVGSNIVYWGVSESHHVVDSVNQRYTIDQTVDYISLGQPMLNFNLSLGLNSTLSVYGLVYFRDRDQPNAETRFRSPILMSNNDAVYEEGNGRNLDFAARFRTSQNILWGGVDFALSYFDGTNRAPSSMPNACLTAGGRFIGETACGNLIIGNPQSVFFVPYYSKLRRYGVEFVYSNGDLQLTFEGALSNAIGETYYSAIGGAQYSFGGIGPNGDTLVVVGEYLYDDRSIIQPANIYDDDVFLGFAYSGNDVAGTNVRGGVYYDVKKDAQIYTVSYSRRINDAIRLEVAGFSVNAAGTNDPLTVAQDDGFVEVSLSYFF